MQRDVYITDEERIKCRRVARAYAEIDDEKVKVIEIGRFGFLRLLYYKYPYGFDDAITYFDSKELFEDLWQDWLYDQLQKIAKDNPVLMELDDDELFEELPEDKKKSYWTSEYTLRKEADLFRWKVMEIRRLKQIEAWI